MLVLPTDQQGIFETLSVRVRSGYDFGLPAEGVEVYSIDQNSCSPSIVGGCFGLERRTSPVPPVASFSSSEHVFGVGESFTVRGMTVTILEKDGRELPGAGGQGQAVTERFIDDNGNFHEPSIEAIAALGITRGCNPPLVDRFCPANNVTRAEMAAFLIAAIGEQPSTAFRRRLSRCSGRAVVHRLRGAAQGTRHHHRKRGRDLRSRSAGDPGGDGGVSQPRLSARAHRPPGAMFGDVPADQWYAQAVEAIRLAGITTGCSADARVCYCPIDPVKRDQMASFVARALGL